MQRLWKIGGVLLLMVLCWGLSAQGGRSNVSILSHTFYKVAFVQLPRIQVNNIGLGIPGKVSAPWLMILLEYKPTPASSGGKGGKGKKSVAESVWIDQLDVEMDISFPAKQNAGLGKKVLLTGTQKLWKVLADGRSHYVLFLVPPQIFAQYSPLSTKESKSEFAQNTKSSRNGIASSMNILVRYKVGQSVLKTDACQAFNRSPVTNDVKGQIWREIEGLKKDRAVFKVEGGILPKARTPWEWVEADLFDLPVPETGGR